MEDAEEMGDRHADFQCLVQFMSVNVNVYAVPLYRVQIFKKKNRKVNVCVNISMHSHYYHYF